MARSGSNVTPLNLALTQVAAKLARPGSAIARPGIESLYDTGRYSAIVQKYLFG
ncbi:MAG: hypothetical protein KME42_09290 [Tildeniella nuda ZEHNDER 1965/U140]|nr:hypothetical protein [Tildeniella nuda ZEHNDER 1965/U140]